MREPDLYPVTIVSDRYNGSYSGGKWLAFLGGPELVNTDYASGDSEAEAYWDSPESEVVGRGDTPDAALDDLKRRLAAHKEGA